MGKRTNMKNILIALILFAATGSSQLYDLENEEYGVMFLPKNALIVKPLNLPQKHIGTFTYFVVWNTEFGYWDVEEIFYSHKDLVGYLFKADNFDKYKVIVTANVY